MDKYALFKECEAHLLGDRQPSSYLRGLDENGGLEEANPFDLLAGLKEIEQSPAFHPEGSVWEHTLLVVDRAAEGRAWSDEPRVFMWAALLHDVGKIPTTKIRRGRITAYDHDREGAKMAARFLRELTDDRVFIEAVSRLIRWHMQSLYVNKSLPFAQVDRMLAEVSLRDIALLSLCDRLGRGDMDEPAQQMEIAGIKSFVERCQPPEFHQQ
ncbi:MAG: HD domain-containing protein [Syntrophomonadaceae bacterium]